MLTVLLEWIGVLLAYWLPGAALSSLIEWRGVGRFVRWLAPFALSIIVRSRTTSQSRFAMPSRWSLPCADPTAGFWPSRKYPLTLPSIKSAAALSW